MVDAGQDNLFFFLSMDACKRAKACFLDCLMLIFTGYPWWEKKTMKRFRRASLPL